MDPQLDTAQRRAEAVNRILSMYQLESVRAGYRVAVQAAICRELQQARREALEEAAKVIESKLMTEPTQDMLELGTQMGLRQAIIALDRLREGEKA